MHSVNVGDRVKLNDSIWKDWIVKVVDGHFITVEHFSTHQSRGCDVAKVEYNFGPVLEMSE